MQGAAIANPQSQPQNSGIPAVSVQGATRAYGSGASQVMALRGIDLTVAEGSFIALKGRSGSGKTTLLNMIGGLDKPTTGEVSLFGRPLSKLSDRQLTRVRRDMLGFIFQSFALLPILSAAENVDLPLRMKGITSSRERRERVLNALALVGLGKWADHRPYEMSGGQQQRVAIARALAANPRLIIADEPTGELDSGTGRDLLTLMRKIIDQQKVTIVMATHDPAVDEFVDIVYNLQDGKLRVQGE
jgi:ABC-type lipoprotein export system ATPase subunit